MKTRNLSFILITVPEYPIDNAVSNLILSKNGTIIDFYTMDIEELAVVAKNRVMPVPTVLIFDGAKVIARVVDKQLSAEQVINVVNFINGENNEAPKAR